MQDDVKQAVFRECFGTKAGRTVLATLLIEMGLFDPDKSTEGDIALANYAAKILKYLGVNRKGNEEQFINAIYNSIDKERK